MPERFSIICSARADPDAEGMFMAMVAAAVESRCGVIERPVWERFAQRIDFVATSQDGGAALGARCPHRSSSFLRRPPKPVGYPRGSWGSGKALGIPGPRGWRLPDR